MSTTDKDWKDLDGDEREAFVNKYYKLRFMQPWLGIKRVYVRQPA